MPRKPRLHVPGGLFHITLRGNGRQPIFFDIEDRRRWEALLAEGLQRHAHRVHAYCWMSNHVHLAVQAHADPLARFVALIASRYAKATNQVTGRSGHLFERRYGAVLVEADTHLKELVRYIHLNPVRAGIVSNPGEYRWSSHRAYLSGNRPGWLTLDFVLSAFGSTVDQARLRYGRFMQSPTDESVWEHLRTGGQGDSRLLGSDDFMRTAGATRAKPRSRLSLDDLIAQACQQHGVTESDLASPLRARNLAAIRAEIGLAAVDGEVTSLAEVARRFNRYPSSLSRGIDQLRTGVMKRNK